MTSTKKNNSRIIVALDYSDQQAAFNLVNQLDPLRCRLKIGKELYTRYGAPWIEKIVAKGFDIFLDLKFHDIPNTVSKALAFAVDLNVWMIDVHALGGRHMLQAAREAIDKANGGRKPLLIAVTVLTSMDSQDIQELGWGQSVSDYVLRLAQLAKSAGLEGVVCSPHEATLLKQRLGASFKLITPGIRLSDSLTHDQKRTMTPVEAVKAGVDYLVIGRAITQAPDPMAILERIELDIIGAGVG